MTTFVTEGGGSHLPSSSIEEKNSRINSWPRGKRRFLLPHSRDQEVCDD
jgi:hypothetical protein